MKTTRLLLWLMFMLSPLFFLNSCEESAEPASTIDGTVSGTLVDEQGYGVPEALVAALDAQSKTLASATTDEDGNFSFVVKNADENSLKIRVSHPNFKNAEEAFKKFIENYGQGKKEKIRFPMRHDDSSCGVIRVTVRDSSTGSFMQDVEVKVRREQKLLKKAKTDSAGVALFRFIKEGTYNLRFARDGYSVVEPNIEVGADCDSVNLTVWMTPKSNSGNQDSCCNSKLIIYAKDSANVNPLQYTTVKLWQGNSLKQSKVSEQNGRVAFENLCPGNYSVSMNSEGYFAKEFNFTVECNDTLEMTKLLAKRSDDSCCDGKIRLYTHDSTTNNALKGVAVKLMKGNTIIQTKTSNDNGYTAFEDLCSGKYVVHILFEKEGYHSWSFPFELNVGCNETVELTKKVYAKKKKIDSCCGSKIILYSKDSETNAALQYTTIKLWQGNVLKYTKVTEQNGRVVFENVCEGSYTVSMNREGYQGKEFNITVGCNENLEFVKQLAKKQAEECCTAKLKLRVKDSTNMSYLQGAEVIIRDKNQQVVKQGTTDAEGWVLLEGLCAPAYYYVTISKAGYISREVKFTYNECKTLQETIWLKED